MKAEPDIERRMKRLKKKVESSPNDTAVRNIRYGQMMALAWVLERNEEV